jgi:hypothetical protein
MATWLRKKLKGLKRSFGNYIAPSLILILVRFLGLTCKIKIHGKEHLGVSSCVYILWHGELVMMPWLYMNTPLSKKPLAVIVSQHNDGEVLSKTMGKLSITSLRGSSTRGGLQALKGALRFVRSGGSVAITPDGPRGPRHSVADGVVAVAQACQVPIVCINCKASAFWQLKSWDKMFIPKPFSQVDFYVQAPKEIASLSKDEAKAYIQSRMLTHAF